MLAAITLRTWEYWPAALIAVAAIGVAVGRVYAPQVRAGRWVLPALRGAAMLALGLSLLRPVLIRSKTIEEQGMVVVLLDKSMSMGTRDRAIGASPADRNRVLGQLVSLADGLGRLPEGARSKEAAGLSDQIKRLESLADDTARTRREAEYARLSGRDPRESQGRLEQAIREFLGVAKSAEQTGKALKLRPAALEQLSRLARAPRPERREEWLNRLHANLASAKGPLEESQSALDEDLYQLNQQVRWVCDDLSHKSRLELSWLALAGGSRSLLEMLDRHAPVIGFSIGDRVAAMPLREAALEGGEPPVRPDAPMSELSGGVRRAMQQLGREPVQAVVLVSDGQQVGGRETIASSLLPSGVPIFTVFAAGPPLKDLAIERVEVPRSAFVGQSLAVRVVARCIGIEPKAVAGEVRLLIDDAPAASAPLRQKGLTLEAELSVRLDRPGLQRLVIELPEQEGEASTENNRVERWVKVLSTKLRVLLVSGSPGWDYRYVRNALGRTGFIALRDAIVSPQTMLAMLPEEILEQDLVVLNDVVEGAMTPEQWDAVRELVSQRGGSIMVIPGLTRPQPEYSGHLLEELMPYPSAARPIWRLWPGQNAHYHLAPTPEGEATGAFRLSDNPATDRRRWEELPGFFRYLAIPQCKANVRVLLTERESQEPILTEGRLGRGRVFFMGMNETWRWRYLVGGRDQDRFWVQLVRYAADEPYVLTKGPLSLDVDKAMAEPDGTIRVRARISPLRDQVLPRELNMAVLHEGQAVQEVTLDPAGNGAYGRYTAVVSGLAAGAYEFQVSLPSPDGIEEELSLPIRIERNCEAELSNLAGDHDFLQRLAESTGGQCVTLEQIGVLPALLAEARQRQPQISELQLWDSPYLFLFVVGCLVAEWALRKRAGLA